MEKLNKSQLAWMLGIRPADARDRMVYAWCKSKGEEVSINYVNEFADGYPDEMDVEFLSKWLNVPNLKQAVDDIHNNYLKRNATRSFILNYPLKKINKALDDARKTESRPAHTSVSIPRVLASMLNDEVYNEIVREWTERYAQFEFLVINNKVRESQEAA